MFGLFCVDLSTHTQVKITAKRDMNTLKFSNPFVFITLVAALSFLKGNSLKAQSKFNKLDSTSLKANCKQSCLFLTGEFHGVASNLIVEQVFSKTLVEQNNVRTILIEEPYTNSYLINKFLETGDTSFLNIYVSDYPMKFVEVRNRILHLYETNKQLPPNDKIKVIAFDIWENTDTPFVKRLFTFLVEREVFDTDLKSEITLIVESDSFPKNIKQIKNILSTHSQNQYSADFDSIIQSYLFWQAYSTNLFNDKNRQKYLYENILAKQYLFRGNVYGNFGYGHIDLTQNSTAYFLKRDSSFRYEVKSYYPYYHNCKSLPWVKMPKHEGYGLINFWRVKLPSGVYLTERKGNQYLIHVSQIGMTELP